jgi:hypothetical protein
MHFESLIRVWVMLSATVKTANAPLLLGVVVCVTSAADTPWLYTGCCFFGCSARRRSGAMVLTAVRVSCRSLQSENNQLSGSIPSTLGSLIGLG